MNAACSRKEHEWTLAGYDVDAFRVTIGHSVGGYRTFACGAVHPYLSNSSRVAVLDDGIGSRRRGHQKRRGDRRVNVLNPCNAAMTIDRGSIRIHRNHIVTSTAQLFEQNDAEVLRIAGDPYHCDSFLCEESFNHFK